MALGVASLVVMAVVDHLIGQKAEFLDAWSLVERLLGWPPSAGDRVVDSRLGTTGGAVAVPAVNAGIGGILTAVVWWFRRG